jgi:deazaflavin-dependent oxidoreductase (nitroreductase family)
MSAPDDWNTQIINEFRANSGKVGGNFEGAPMVLVHHTGRKTGKQNVTPMMYLLDDNDPNTIYVFASKAGAPSNPAWYYNLTTAGTAQIELGTDTHAVTVTEVTGADRDRIYNEQARRYPGFADYEKKTAGIRTIPVLALKRT